MAPRVPAPLERGAGTASGSVFTLAPGVCHLVGGALARDGARPPRRGASRQRARGCSQVARSAQAAPPPAARAGEGADHRPRPVRPKPTRVGRPCSVRLPRGSVDGPRGGAGPRWTKGMPSLPTARCGGGGSTSSPSPHRRKPRRRHRAPRPPLATVAPQGPETQPTPPVQRPVRPGALSRDRRTDLPAPHRPAARPSPHA